MHRNWAEKSSIGIFLVNFQKWSEQLYDGKLSTAHDSGCCSFYISQTKPRSLVIFAVRKFCQQRAYGTLKQNLVKFLTTFKSLKKMLNHLDHIIWQINCANIRFFGRQIQDFAVPKETWKFSERSPIIFCRFKV